MESVLCGVSSKLQWCIGSRDGDVGQLGEFSLPAGTGLEDVRGEVWIVPAPLLCPQSLDKDLGSCGVWDNDPERIILAGKHLIDVPHSRGLTVWWFSLEAEPIRRTIPPQTQSQLLWIVALLGQPQLRAFGSRTVLQFYSFI